MNPGEVPPAVVEAAAAAAYGAWQQLSLAIGRDAGAPWEALPATARDGHVQFVRLGLSGYNPGEQHGQWVANMRADGWHWGARFDAEQRLHPGLCDWESLPATQRAYDVCRDTAATALVDTWRQHFAVP